MSKLVQINTADFEFNAFNLKSDWGLVAAGSPDSMNAMTVAWGGFGVLWNKSVFFVPIRPERYTYNFTEKHDTISLSFFNPTYKSMLEYFGTVSGRDENKIEKSGLTVRIVENTPIFEEARVTIIGRKLYQSPLEKKDFVDMVSYNTFYSGEGEHRLYIYEVTSLYGGT